MKLYVRSFKICLSQDITESWIQCKCCILIAFVTGRNHSTSKIPNNLYITSEIYTNTHTHARKHTAPPLSSGRNIFSHQLALVPDDIISNESLQSEVLKKQTQTCSLFTSTHDAIIVWRPTVNQGKQLFQLRSVIMQDNNRKIQKLLCSVISIAVTRSLIIPI